VKAPGTCSSGPSRWRSRPSSAAGATRRVAPRPVIATAAGRPCQIGIGSWSVEVRPPRVSDLPAGVEPFSAWKSCLGNGTKDASTNLITEYQYGERGNRVAVIAPDPAATTGTSTATVTTRYAYDSDNRPCRVLENATVDLASLADPCITSVSGTESQNVSTRYTYDGMGNLASMIDGRGNTTSYGYDEAGRMLTLTDPTNGTTTWSYDALGNRSSQSERGSSNTLISWTYDGAGRVLSRTAGGQTTTYSYDEAGNRKTAQSAAGTITTTYDRLNRTLSVTVSGDGSAATSYSYSLSSPSWTDPTGTYTAILDKFDRQLSLADPIHGSSTFSWSYRADGQPSSMTPPNGNVTAYGYDTAGSLSSKVTTGSGSASRADYGWHRNRAGQILSEDSTIDNDPSNGTTSYSYDKLSRLASFTRAQSPTGYAWQEVPNRSSVQVGGDPAVTTAYDAANRPTTDSTGGSYDHDAEGRLTARPGQTLTWDGLGRLTGVIDPVSEDPIASYTYDALDRLLTVERPGVDHIRFRYVGLTTLVAEIVEHQDDQDPSDDPVLHSIANDWNGERLLDWTGSGSNERFYGTNAHHDVTWTADATGAVSNTLRYDPWGTLSDSWGSSLPDFRFQGSWQDTTTDLQWVITRWYAPALGRFISEDSLLGEPEDPPSRHLYAYGAAEPVGRWDPDGRFWYRAQRGQTLRGIARIFSVPYADIAAKNPRLVGITLNNAHCVNVPRPAASTANWCYRPGAVNLLVFDKALRTNRVRLQAGFGQWAQAWAEVRLRILTDGSGPRQPITTAELRGDGALLKVGGAGFFFDWRKMSVTGAFGFTQTPVYCLGRSSPLHVSVGQVLPCRTLTPLSEWRVWAEFNPGYTLRAQTITTGRWRLEGNGFVPPVRVELRTEIHIQAGYEPWVYVAVPVAAFATVMWPSWVSALPVLRSAPAPVGA
jgi:RHS repeat-associated protein